MLPKCERVCLVWLCLAFAGCAKPPEVAHPAARAGADDPEAAPTAVEPTGPVLKYPAGDPNLPGDADYRAADKLLRGDGVDVNYAEAFVLIKRAAGLKHLLARARLATMLTWSDYLILADEAEAEAIFREILTPLRELARAGDTEAEHFLGRYFESDWCPTPDVQKAIEWHEKAAAKGYDRSEALLAARMIAGDGLPKDASAGLDRLRVVAAKGSPAIQERLAGVLWGLDSKAHAREAFGLCRAAAERNEPDAQHRLALAYLSGTGVEVDFGEANVWLRRAAGQNMAAAQFLLACAYPDTVGKGGVIAVTKAESDELLNAAALQGYSDAQYRKGMDMLLLAPLGFGRDGQPAEAVEAVTWVLRAARNGHADAQHQMGLCYGLGRGVRRDDVQSVGWYRAAAAQGHARGRNMLWKLLANDPRLQARPDEARTLLVADAESGDKEAEYYLGSWYAVGKGFDKDLKESTAWYLKSAEQGYGNAQHDLACHYAEGMGIGKDEKQATYWFRQAAENGLTDSQYNLGLRYARGLGTEQDIPAAKRWLERAARNGHRPAGEELKKLP